MNISPAVPQKLSYSKTELNRCAARQLKLVGTRRNSRGRYYYYYYYIIINCTRGTMVLLLLLLFLFRLSVNIVVIIGSNVINNSV